MKKTSLPVLFFIGVVSLLWWNYFGHDKIKAKQEAEAYYAALMNQDYENAFEHLYIYDEHTDVGTTLSNTDAKEIYLEKTKYLQKVGYKIKEFQIERVRTEDGVVTLINTFVTIESDGKTETKRETLQLAKNKILVDYSEDKLSKLRDGMMKMAQ